MTAVAPASTDATQTERATLLFVDDEPGVLDGIRLALRPVRKEFRFFWASSAQEAQVLLDTNDVDVIISDMRMPAGTGADLLEAVCRDHPGVVRYILSGEASPDLVMRAMLTAHRWLSKPCPRDELVQALHDATRYRRLMRNPAIAEIVAGTSALPTLPEKYCRLQALLSDPDATLDDVTALVETDPATSAKLLQLANSAFAAGVQSATVRDAVGRVGLVAVAQLVLSVEVSRAMGAGEIVPGLPAESLDTYGNAVSSVAQSLALPSDRAVAAIGGLLSPVGILLQAAAAPDRLQRTYDLATESGTALHTAERELYDVTHADLAGYLLSIWGLPTDLVLAVAETVDLPDPEAQPPFSATTALQVARLIVMDRSAPELGLPPDLTLGHTMNEAVRRWAEHREAAPQ